MFNFNFDISRFSDMIRNQKHHKKSRTNKAQNLAQDDDEHEKELFLEELLILEERLASLQNTYQFMEDDELIEAVIFEENGVRARLAYLRRKARENTFRLNFYEREEVELRN